jgi:hypothetical protein
MNELLLFGKVERDEFEDSWVIGGVPLNDILSFCEGHKAEITVKMFPDD